VFIFLRNRSLYTNGHTGYAKNGDVRILYLEIPRYYRYIVEFNRVISQNGFSAVKMTAIPTTNTQTMCQWTAHKSVFVMYGYTVEIYMQKCWISSRI